jgi:hypothetical protein
VQGLLDFLKSLGAARMAAMCAVTVALVGFFGFNEYAGDGIAIPPPGGGEIRGAA